MTLTFHKLRTTNISRCARWHPIESWSLSDWGIAAAGEMGEACNIIKKLNRYRDGMVGNKQSKEELQEALAGELADVIIYLDLLATRAGINLEEAVTKTFNKKSIELDFPERL